MVYVSGVGASNRFQFFQITKCIFGALNLVLPHLLLFCPLAIDLDPVCDKMSELRPLVKQNRLGFLYKLAGQLSALLLRGVTAANYILNLMSEHKKLIILN
jgi:hypothetical protein